MFLGISEFVLYVWDYQKSVSVKGYSVPHWWVRAKPDWVGDFKRFLSAYEGDPAELGNWWGPYQSGRRPLI